MMELMPLSKKEDGPFLMPARRGEACAHEPGRGPAPRTALPASRTVSISVCRATHLMCGMGSRSQSGLVPRAVAVRGAAYRRNTKWPHLVSGTQHRVSPVHLNS